MESNEMKRVFFLVLRSALTRKEGEAPLRLRLGPRALPRGLSAVWGAEGSRFLAAVTLSS